VERSEDNTGGCVQWTESVRECELTCLRVLSGSKREWVQVDADLSFLSTSLGSAAFSFFTLSRFSPRKQETSYYKHHGRLYLLPGCPSFPFFPISSPPPPVISMP
jgi:hypothetical protein